MVVIKNKLFSDENREIKYLFILLMYLEVNKNYIERCVFTINGFLSMFEINTSKKNIDDVRKALLALEKMDILSYKILNKKDKDSDSISVNTVLFVRMKYNREEFRKYDDDFVFKLLKSFGSHKSFSGLVELYLYILSKMYYDVDSQTLKDISLSYENIIKNTSICSKSTIKSYIDVFQKEGFLEIGKRQSQNNGYTYHTYSLPKEFD